jgi:hypothetical protein
MRSATGRAPSRHPRRLVSSSLPLLIPATLGPGESPPRHGGDSLELCCRGCHQAPFLVPVLLICSSPQANQGESPPLSPLPNLTARLTDLIRDPNQAEAPLSPTTSAPERTEEDSAAVAVARSNRSPEDTTAQKGGGFCAFRLLGLVGVGLESNSWASDAFLQIKEGLKQLC